METEWRVRGIRGATTVPEDSKEAIMAGTRELVEAIIAANDLTIEEIASGLFTVTADLSAEFPAAGARAAGLVDVALLCGQEIPVAGSLPRCIRALFHVNTAKPASKLVHVYLHGAQALRPDRVYASAAVARDASPPGRSAPLAAPPIRPSLLSIEPYVPGKPIEEVRAELGLTDVIKLASNENPLGPSPRAVQALREAVVGVDRYPDGKAARLCGRLAAKHAVPVESIAVGNGSDEVVRLLVQAFVEPGDEVVMADCTFSEYERATRLMGGRPVKIPLVNETHDLDGMAAACGPRTRLVFVCNPNNPTGAMVDRRAARAFLDRLPAGVLAVFDEAYYEYVRSPDYPETLDWLREGRPVAVLRTFSKIYGLAGLRVGYGVAPPAVVAALERARDPFNVNLLAQKAAVAALDDQEHVERSLAANATGVSYLTAELTRLGWSVTPTEANFLWVDTGQDGRGVFEALLKAGVIVRTGDVFGRPAHLRISVGTADENRRLVAALQEIVTRAEPLGAKGGIA